MSMWSPTHVQFTVLRARNLVAKGKGGNNDVFVTIQLGREKYQTSTIKNALNPEWFEECELSIPHMQSAVQVTLYHRGVLSDVFLGYAAVPIWEHRVSDAPRSSWVSLHNRPSTKAGDSKYRGELEVKVTFHCQSKAELAGGGLKKRSNSIRNLASAFGDKFKFTRSRSFRENRRDPEGGKVDRAHTISGTITPDVGEDGFTRSYSMTSAEIKTMSLQRSASLLNGSNFTVPSNGNTSNAYATPNDTKSGSHGAMEWPSAGASQTHGVPRDRRSCSELPSQTPPLPPHLRSQDDSALVARSNGDTRPDRVRAMSDVHQGSVVYSSRAGGTTASLPHRQPPPPPPPSRRDLYGSGGPSTAGIYESIKERTEPESSRSSSSSSSSDGESVPKPRPPRTKGSGSHHLSAGWDVPGGHNTTAPHPVQDSVYNTALSPAHQKQQQQMQQLYRQPHRQPDGPIPERPAGLSASPMKDILLHSQQPTRPKSYPTSVAPPLDASLSVRDSGILEDRSSSQGNSLEGSGLTIPERGQLPLPGPPGNTTRSQYPGEGRVTPDPGGILYHLDRALAISRPVQHKDYSTPLYGTAGQNEPVSRKKSRGERDRIRQMRQAIGVRRHTVQPNEPFSPNSGSDSQSEGSTSPRQEVSEDLMSVYSNMNKEELLRVVIQSRAQLIRKDQYIRDLETYIDDLLVRVMETTPRLLSRPPNLRRF